MAQHCEGERAHSLSIYDVGWLASLGWQVAEIEDDHRGAIEALRPYLEHPARGEDDLTSRLIFDGYYAQSLLFAGEEREALRILRAMIEEPRARPSDALTAARIAFSPLHFFLQEQPEEGPASPELAELVEEVARRQRRGRIWLQAGSAPTFGLLRDLLEATLPFLPGPLYDEVESLEDRFDREGPSPELQESWRRIWEQYLADDRLIHAPIDEVTAVTHLGWALAMGEGRWTEAGELIDRFLTHPRVRQATPENRAEMECARAASRLCAGEEAEALAQFRSQIDNPDRRAARAALKQVWEHLMDYCEERKAAPASAELLDLAEEAIRRLRRRKNVWSRPPGAATCADVAALLRTAGPHARSQD
jgi:hypothetical protein